MAVAGSRMALCRQRCGAVLCGPLMCSHHDNAGSCLETMSTKAAFNEVGCILSFPLLSLLKLESPVVQCFSAICFPPLPSVKKIKLDLPCTSVTASSQQESALFPAKGLSTEEQLPLEIMPLLQDWHWYRTGHPACHPPKRPRSFGALSSISSKRAIFWQ